MVMWQILIGRVLKAWNNQVLRPARGSAVHVLLLKEGREKKNYIKKKKKGDIPCSKNHAVFQIQERLLFFHRVQRVRQGEGVHASAFEEHHASTSENCDTLTL